MNIKTYTTQESTSSEDDVSKIVDELSAILVKHLDFMLLDYVLVNRVELLKTSLTSESNPFDLLMVLISNPIKIRLNFYL
jgi:hypothetical protein